MATFEVKVVRITIEPHPNADRLECAVFEGYRSVVAKGSYRSGDLVAYIPEGAVIPEPVLREANLWDADKGKGKCSGSKGNRVKAVTLRGVLSQGVVLRAHPNWVEGQDVQETLGIVKYEPPIPPALWGQVVNVGTANIVGYDIENWKRYPNILQPGEPVVFTEKCHGTWTEIGVLPYEIPGYGDLVVCSKGFGAQGLAFKHSPENAKNVYLRVAHKFQIRDRVKAHPFFKDIPTYILGETLGVQAGFLYGTNPGQDAGLGFRVFDIFVGSPRTGRFLSDNDLTDACWSLGLDRVPVLYRGPFSAAAMREHTDGRETVSGKSLHIREGIVMRPQIERTIDNPHLPNNRVQFKSVSDAYLNKSTGEEFN